MIAVVLTAICISLSLSNFVYADYIYGYLRYIVEDESVIITGYYGDESVVTVPAMIGGNPVNTIASGAFAGSGVTAVYLPDTIMSVEGGAFGPGQAVVYNSYSMTAPEGTVTGEMPASDEETTSFDSPTDPSEIPTSSGPVGIWDEQGNLITIDDEQNLILVDPAGNETVLDNTQDYEANQDGQGNVSIQNVDGGMVAVADGGTIEFTDGEGRTVSMNTVSGGSVITDPDSGMVYEEIEIDLEDEPIAEPETLSEPEPSADQETTTEPESQEEVTTPIEQESISKEITSSEPESPDETVTTTADDNSTEDIINSETSTEEEAPTEETLTESETPDEKETLIEPESVAEPEITTEPDPEPSRSVTWPYILAAVVVLLVVIIFLIRKLSRKH